jgi:transitional endoplasmic reticulum ATPase
VTDPASRDTPAFTLTARLATAPLDARRSIARLHGQALARLGLTVWSGVRLTGRRVSGALVALRPDEGAAGEVHCDDLTLGNLGLRDGEPVGVTPLPLRSAGSLVVAGAPDVMHAVPLDMLQRALLGKVIAQGDNVSLLPQDVAPTGPPDVAAVRRRLSDALGMAWTTTLLTVVAASPPGPALVTEITVLRWRDRTAMPAALLPAPGTPAAVLGVAVPVGSVPATATGHTVPVRAAEMDAEGPVQPDDQPVPPVDDLPGLEAQAGNLREWLDLGLRRRHVLARLGSTSQLGMLVTGPLGSGRRTLVRAVARAAEVATVRCSAAAVAALSPPAATEALRGALTTALGMVPAVLLIEDIEALAPRDAVSPVLATLLDVVRTAAASEGVAVVCTAVSAAGIEPELRRPGGLDREISLRAPDRADRRALLDVLLRGIPVDPDVSLDEVAARTPGYVAGDLVALRREAAVRAAIRQRDEQTPSLGRVDLLGALDVVRPAIMVESTLDVPELSLDDVGDMAETKQALTETVLWPLSRPDTFARLGIEPPHGVLLYGPPGCGKTFLVRALAGSGQVNVLSVKGAELLSKWVGESERGVRDLFRRAREVAPALIFVDEIDALAPERGQSADSGVSDRVVAALLTELDGIETLRDVVVIGATNRPDLIDPALLRPGRLERLIHVPPPDATARRAILLAAARSTPLAAGVDLESLAADLDGFSAADCAALIREAALAAMRRTLEATDVTAPDLAAARRAVRPSLRPEQIAAYAAYAAQHSH